MTTQDLKNRKSYIIAKVKSLGCEENLKSFMDIMLMEAPFFKGTVYELVMDVYNNHYRARAKRSGHKLAEFAGNNENRTFNQLTKEYQYN
ncbi:MAG: hypothetical protein ACOVLD_04920 [Bacteroidia bacterium]|jgi:hypothetical protein